VGSSLGLYQGEIGGSWDLVGGYTFRVTSIRRQAGRVVVGVGSGLWEVDFEEFWKQLHDETLTEVLDIAWIPGDPGVVAASAYGVGTGRRDELGAVRWTFHSDELQVEERFSNAVLVEGDGRWLVGTEAGLLMAEDAGQRWTHTSLMGSPVRGLCRALGAFWAGTDERGIWRSADGLRWERVGGGLDGGTVFGLAESHGRLVAGTLEGVVVGDGQGTWHRVGPRMLTAAVGTHPAEGDVWLAGADSGGLWITENGGGRWQQVDGLPTAVEAIAAPEVGA